MQIQAHTAENYRDALNALLPAGQAWVWPAGGQGDALQLSMGQELARVDTALPAVLAGALSAHKPQQSAWHLSDYQRVVAALCTANGWPQTSVTLSHLTQPLHAGSRVGDRVWSGRARFLLRVKVTAPAVAATVQSALEAMCQAQVRIFLEAS